MRLVLTGRFHVMPARIVERLGEREPFDLNRSRLSPAQLSSRFDRDLTDFQLRKERGLVLEGFDTVIGISLREQISRIGATSANDVWRLLGLKSAAPEGNGPSRQKARAAARLYLPKGRESNVLEPVDAVPGSNGQAPHYPANPCHYREPDRTLKSPLDDLIRSLQECLRWMELVDLDCITFEERAVLVRHWMPIFRAVSKVQHR
jgi:hypothetical protein